MNNFILKSGVFVVVVKKQMKLLFRLKNSYIIRCIDYYRSISFLNFIGFENSLVIMFSDFSAY